MNPSPENGLTVEELERRRIHRWMDNHKILVHAIAFGVAAFLGLLLCLLIGFIKGEFP